MSDLPYLPLFVGDFVSATALWEGEEQGLYLLLLTYQWAGGPLPPDLCRLARALRYDETALQRMWPVVGSKFTQTSDGLINLRLEEHRKRATELSKKNAESGRLGARSRWRKDGERHRSANGEKMANAIEMDGERHRSANGETMAIQSNPIQSKKKKNLGGFQPPEWQQIRDAYPKRAGEQKWSKALQAAHARIREGDSWQQLLAGAQRYARFIATTGRTGTEYVKQAATFFGPDRGYTEAWDPPQEATEGRSPRRGPRLELIPLVGEQLPPTGSDR